MNVRIIVMIVMNCYEYSDKLLFPFFHFHFLDMPTADRWFITDQSSAAKTFRGREIGRRWSDNQPADNLRPLSTPIFTTFSISEGIGRIWGANFARAEFFVCNRNSICEIINKWFCSQNSTTMTWVDGNILVQQSVNQAGTICGTFVQRKSGIKIFVLFVFYVSRQIVTKMS